jgi:hypothetical protein
MSQAGACSSCGCQGHNGQTWEVRCATCKEFRWPYQERKPGLGWVCMRCRSLPTGKRETRVAKAVRARKTRVKRMDDFGVRFNA